MADNGDLLAGSSGKGQLFRISGPGRATVVANLQGEEVKAIVDRAYARCEAILTEKRPQLELTARYLLDHETMEADVFAKVFTDPGAEEFAPYRQQKD